MWLRPIGTSTRLREPADTGYRCVMRRRFLMFLLTPLIVAAGCVSSAASGPGSTAAKESALFCHDLNSTILHHGWAYIIEWNPNFGLAQQLNAAIKMSPVQKLHRELAAWESENKNFE